MGDLRNDATEIWNAGVDAVRARPLVQREVRLDDSRLVIGDHQWSRSDFDRVIIVGAGKAGTAMAEGLMDSIGGWLPVVGWVNVPSGTESSLGSIRLHAARPPGINEPTEEGVAGTSEILKLVEEATDRDLCIALISGGGSALLPAPVEGITLADKQAVTRFLSAGGADITELNTVRKHLSRVKGGGLLRACRARELVTLVLSDVLGDPVDLIASGPTVPDSSSPEDAIAALEKYDRQRLLPASVYGTLARAAAANHHVSDPPTCPFTTRVLGNNAVAVDAAGIRAEQAGYNHVMHCSRRCEGDAEEVGRHLADLTLGMLRAAPTDHRTDCLITGGEPTVTLAPLEERGRGGRNQQLVLAAYQRLLQSQLSEDEWSRLCILSGGTDGEDGPTDAAGAIVDLDVHQKASEMGLDCETHLATNDAYSFFQKSGGLLVTGPTGTNVCDVRVAVVSAGNAKSGKTRPPR